MLAVLILKLQLLTARKKEWCMAGHSGQFTPDGYLSTVKRIALAGIEPTTFRLLVQRATSYATDVVYI